MNRLIFCSDKTKDTRLTAGDKRVDQTFTDYFDIRKDHSTKFYRNGFTLQVKNIHTTLFSDSEWFRNIYKSIRNETITYELGIFEAAVFKRRCSKCQIGPGSHSKLLSILKGNLRICIPEIYVSWILQRAHNLGEHLLSSKLLRKLKNI